MLSVAYLTYFERKVIGAMHLRRGPNVVGPFGLLQPIADGVKLFLKETVVPTGDLRGRLRVALPLTFGPTHLTPLLAELAQQHPHLQIHMSYSDRFVDLVEEGYDCAVRFGKLESSALLATRVGNLYATLVASPDYIAAHGAPETPRDLADHQAILQGTEPCQFSKDGQITTINPQGRIKADNGGAIAEAAVAGLGIALLPDGLIVDHVASGKLVHIMPGYMPPVFGIYVVRPASQFRTRKIQLLTKLLIDRFREPDCTTGPATRPLIRSPNMPVG